MMMLRYWMVIGTGISQLCCLEETPNEMNLENNAVNDTAHFT